VAATSMVSLKNRTNKIIIKRLIYLIEKMMITYLFEMEEEYLKAKDD
jgi:hypothetical protein